jgi:hypothetical protein
MSGTKTTAAKVSHSVIALSKALSFFCGTSRGSLADERPADEIKSLGIGSLIMMQAL